MQRPRFSIVIPTRERPDTLRVALSTCLEQDFDGFEVIVCDNAGSPATRAVVDAARSARITYHRVEQPIAMSANWELAVSLARGEYVTVVGDDDALMPYALRELDRLVEEHDRPEAVHWKRGIYSWPTIPVEGEANVLRLPLTRSRRVFSGRERLATAARWEIGPDELPMIYTSVVRHDLIARHRQIAGRVFPSIHPDVYSGYAFAYLAERYVSVDVPMGIAGLSAASNGVAILLQDGRSPVAREFVDLNRAAGLHVHPAVPDLFLMPIHPDDCFLHARDLLFPDDPDLVLDRRRMVERYLAAIPETDPEKRAEIRLAIRDSLADRPDLLEWFDSEAPDPPPSEPFRIKPARLGYLADFLFLDASRFGVTDVAGAASLARDLLGIGDEPVEYDTEADVVEAALDSRPTAEGAPVQSKSNVDRGAQFNEFLHELRTRELRRLPPGARTVLSGGCAGSLYFDWFGANYPTPVERHIGVEAYTEKPHELPPEVEWLQRTLGDLGPVGAGEVDLVFAGEVFEHMWPEEIAGFLREAHRVLRPGGHLVLDSPNRRVTSALGWIHPEHTVEFTPGEATQLLTLAGFDHVRVRGLWLCHDPGFGFIPVELDAGGPDWPPERRVAEAEERPDDAFVWWAEAARGEREPDRAGLEARVHEIYATVRPLALDRLRSEVGSLEVCAAGTIVRAEQGQSGLLVRGPGIAMPAGKGSITFWLGRPCGGRDDGGTLVGAVELTSGGSVVASKAVTSEELGDDGGLQRVTVEYSLAETAFDSDFRVRSTGAGPLVAALHVLVDEGAGRPARSSSLSDAWDRVTLSSATPVSVTGTHAAARPGLRAVARFLLWPVRRFFDPRIQGVLAHTDARHRELLARVELLDARVQELSARIDSLQRTDD